MQKAVVHGAGVVGILSIFLAGLVLTTPRETQAASIEAIITSSGRTISSIFYGLRPSSYAHYEEEQSAKSEKRRRISKLLEDNSLDAHLGARYLVAQCGQCSPNTACAGHYEVIVDSSGCIDSPPGACTLPLHNAHTDTRNGSYSQGARDTYCGLYCCLDAEDCPNP
jgi:hypothetical protein